MLACVQKIQKGDTVVLRFVAPPCPKPVKGSPAATEAAARAAMRGTTLQVWLHRARCHEPALADPYTKLHVGVADVDEDVENQGVAA